MTAECNDYYSSWKPPFLPYLFEQKNKSNRTHGLEKTFVLKDLNVLTHKDMKEQHYSVLIHIAQHICMFPAFDSKKA